jgi:hypothetical protein
MINANGNYIGFGTPSLVRINSEDYEIYFDGDYEIIKLYYNSASSDGSGSFSIPGNKEIEYLIVGGGGAGATYNDYLQPGKPGGGGGGAGQLLSGSFWSLSNYQYDFRVGKNGLQLPNVIPAESTLNSNNGAPSYIQGLQNTGLLNLQALGGGAGGNYATNVLGKGGLVSNFIYNDIQYTLHTFLSGSTTFEFTSSTGVDAQVFVVGGGGGGQNGGAAGQGGSGGGAGGVVDSVYTLSRNASGSTTWTVQVGNGGAANTNGQTSSITPNFSGPSTIVAYGGATGTLVGGGAAGSGTGSQGFNGGVRSTNPATSSYAAPGGGGASSAGTALNFQTTQYWRWTPIDNYIPNILTWYAYNISGSRVYTDVFWPFPSCTGFNNFKEKGPGDIVYFDPGPQNIKLFEEYSAQGAVTSSTPCGANRSAILQMQFSLSGSADSYYPYWDALVTNSGSFCKNDPRGCQYVDGVTFFARNYTASQNFDGAGSGGRGISGSVIPTGLVAGGGGGSISTEIIYPASGGFAVDGGGNGSYTSSQAGGTGSVNTGGGGGGGVSSNTVGLRTNGGAGGSGIVYIAYPTTLNASASGSNGGSGGGAGFLAGDISFAGAIGLSLGPLGNNGGTADVTTAGPTYNGFGGGGGGATQVGGNAFYTATNNGVGGNGGSGSFTTISGSGQYYAGGGAGGYYVSGSETGKYGLGGPGGGGGYTTASISTWNRDIFTGLDQTGGGGGVGADGGSGVIILRFNTKHAELDQ